MSSISSNYQPTPLSRIEDRQCTAQSIVKMIHYTLQKKILKKLTGRASYQLLRKIQILYPVVSLYLERAVQYVQYNFFLLHCQVLKFYTHLIPMSHYQALDNFVGAVNHMQEVVMVPSRLKDIDPIAVPASKNGAEADNASHSEVERSCGIGNRSFHCQNSTGSPFDLINVSPPSSNSAIQNTGVFTGVVKQSSGNGPPLSSRPVFIVNSPSDDSEFYGHRGEGVINNCRSSNHSDRHRSLFTNNNKRLNSNSFDFNSQSTNLFNSADGLHQHPNNETHPNHNIPSDLFACYKLLGNVRKELLDGREAVAEETAFLAYPGYDPPFSQLDSYYDDLESHREPVSSSSSSSSLSSSSAGAEEVQKAPSSSSSSARFDDLRKSTLNSIISRSSDQSQRRSSSRSRSSAARILESIEENDGADQAENADGTLEKTATVEKEDLVDQEAEQLGLTFRYHLNGLFNVVRQLTEHANTVSQQYIDQFEKHE